MIKQLKNTVQWTYTLKELNGKETAETFYKKELQKTNQREFRIKKAIKKNDDEFYLKWKGYDNLFSRWRIKKDVLLSNAVLSRSILS